jgi:HlyD family secretion protein
MKPEIMPERRNRYILWGGLAIALLVGLGFAFLPRPVAADVAQVAREPMSVAVAEEGKTQIHDVYTILAPVAGDISRIDLRPGDAVVAGETVIARLRPVIPAFLEARSRAELAAAARAADAAVSLADAQIQQAAADREMAHADLDRDRDLAARKVIAVRDLQVADIAAKAKDAAYAAAVAQLDVRRAEAEQAHAALMEPTGVSPDAASATVPILAPATGRVLDVRRESGGVAATGETLVEIGDPNELEVVVDLLSEDAVKVREGAKARFVAWGDEAPLYGRVRTIPPYGYTKISALGIEEQRVDVILDFDSPAEAWRRLGHGYRVEVQIKTWSKNDAVTAPLAALFREGDQWEAFVIRRGRAQLAGVQVGHRNTTKAEILAGLEPGDRVVLHPPSKLSGGSTVATHDVAAPAADEDQWSDGQNGDVAIVQNR